MSDAAGGSPGADRGGYQRVLPGPVALYVGALFAFAVGCGAASVTLFEWSGHVSWPLFASFLVLLTVAEYLMLRFQYRDEVMGLNLFEAVLAPLIVVVPGVVLLVLVAAAQAIASILRRNRRLKASFNVAQWVSAAGVGSILFNLLREGTALSLRNVAVLVVAMTAVALVNTLAFAEVMVLAQRQPQRQVLRSLAPAILLGWVINTAFGVLFVASYQWSPAAIGLFFVPLFVLHRAYRGHATALADRARLSGMHRATRALATPMNPREAIPRFLSEVRDCFQSDVVDLVLLEDGVRRVHRVRGGRPISYAVGVESRDEETLAAALIHRAEPVRVTAGHPDLAVGSLLRREGWRDCLAAPLVADDQVVGVLCTYNRSGLEGFEEGELAVLQALAGEAAGMIQKGALLEAVFEERRKLSEIVDHTSDGILTLAPDGTIRSWNPGLERISGFRADEMVGTRLLGSLRLRDADDRDLMIERWAGEDTALPSDLQLVTRTGEVRWLSCSYTQVPDAEGRPGLLIVVARDATQAREIERLKDDFVATVSHELRTPLTPIRGWATTLLRLGERLDEAQRREGLQAISRQSERLERLITNLLEVSKIERGAGDHRDGIVNVQAVVGKVVDEFRSAGSRNNIHLDLPSRWCRARGDELWVQQIVSNLLSNAIKYSPATEPIEVRVAEGPDEIEIAVIDRGPGIPEHEADRIFDRFQRLGDHLTRSHSGAGLGLYIARQLAHAIGGTLTVTSVPGSGSTFSLKLRPAGGLVAVG